jgi:hypothetical protein
MSDRSSDQVMNGGGRDRLAVAYCSLGVDEDRARTLAEEVALEPDVLAAALTWLDTGQFPTSPAVEGFTPRSLAASHNPMGVFGTLVGLRRMRESTLTILRRDSRGLDTT